MSEDNPGWGEDRTALELRLKFRVEHSTSTIDGTWFAAVVPGVVTVGEPSFRNDQEEILACDFLSQHLRGRLVYVFVVMASPRVASS